MKFFLRIRKSIKKIRLVDRCLIIFMVVLMVQSAYNLFVNETNSDGIHGIDTMLRTTSAAIFGYFLSVNFIKKPDATVSTTNLPTAQTIQVPPIMQEEKPSIGFVPSNHMLQASAAPAPEAATYTRPEDPTHTTQELLQEEQEEEAQTSNQQIIIAATVGLCALLILIVARNFLELTPSTIATITQMRDFVSGCVGFLIGSPSTTQTSTPPTGQ